MNNLITNLLHGVLPHRDDADNKVADAPLDTDGSAADVQDDGVESYDATPARAAVNAADGEPTKTPSGRHRADTTPDEVRTEGERSATHSAPHHDTSHQTSHSATHATIAGDSALTSVGEYRKQRGELDTTPEHEHS